MVILWIEHEALDDEESERLKLWGRRGSAENVVAWQKIFPKGCVTPSVPESSSLRSSPIGVPDALCFWYENGSFLVAQIKGNMCEACYKVLVGGFVTMTATYTAGYFQENGSWVDEDFDAEIYSPGVVNTIDSTRESRVRQSSYEEIAALAALREDGRPFYYDKACLLKEYDPRRGIDHENVRIRRETLYAFIGCILNYGFDGGDNCSHELNIVENRHHRLSRRGIYVGYCIYSIRDITDIWLFHSLWIVPNR
jgi:hypothetical protein